MRPGVKLRHRDGKGERAILKPEPERFPVLDNMLLIIYYTKNVFTKLYYNVSTVVVES